MNDKIKSCSESGPVDRTAAEWYVSLDAEQPDSPTESEFATWLESDLESEARFERCEAAVKLLRELEFDPDMQWVFKDAAKTASGESSQRHEPHPAWPHNPRLAWGIAGVAVMVAVAAVLYRGTPVESGGDAIAESRAPFTAETVAGQAVDQIITAEDRRIQLAQAAQDQVEETRASVEEYRAVMKAVDALIVYNTLLERQIADQEEVLQDRARDDAGDARRIQEFERAQDNQRRLLNEALAEKAREEARSARLETTFEEMELLIVGVTEQIWTPKPITPMLD